MAIKCILMLSIISTLVTVISTKSTIIHHHHYHNETFHNATEQQALLVKITEEVDGLKDAVALLTEDNGGIKDALAALIADKDRHIDIIDGLDRINEALGENNRALGNLLRSENEGSSRQSTCSCCPPNTVHMDRVSTCRKTCVHPDGEDDCQDSYIQHAGCGCPEGFLWRGTDCVHVEDCGCFVSPDIGLLLEDDVYTSYNCSKKCVCDNTGEFVCSDYQCDGNAICNVTDAQGMCQCKEGLVGDGESCMEPRDCHTLQLAGETQDGVYTIIPLNWPGSPFQVFCDMATDGGGWTVFQRRQDGSVDFFLNWISYKQGFGDVKREHWLGNEQLYYLTNQARYELRIDMTSQSTTKSYAKYTSFRVGNEAADYRLRIGTYSGTAGYDAMAYHRNRGFSTYDHDVDSSSANCAENCHGAWWYGDCRYSNLNGGYDDTGSSAIQWNSLPGGTFNIQYTEMKIRALG